MPYLHWEIEKRLVRMTNVAQQTKRLKERESAFERLTKQNGTWGSVVGRAKVLKRDTNGTMPEHGVWTHDCPCWRPKSPLGAYLWQAAKLFQLIDEAADWRLISDHLCTQSPLHPRRTLEQYYNWTASETGHRDRQQVVYRETRMRNDPEAVARVVMVDQLWMWILDESESDSALKRDSQANNPQTPSSPHSPADGAATSRTRPLCTGRSATA
jgi:hypothetical protein